MHTLQIPDKNLKIDYASTIEELTYGDFMWFMQLLIRQQGGSLSILDFRVLLAIRLLKIKLSTKYHLLSDEKKLIVHTNINLIVNSLDTFYTDGIEDGNPVKKIDLTWIKQMIPRIGRLYGPADALTDCTFYEYKEAYHCYLQYLGSRDDADINRLIAILYRERPLLYAFRRRFLQNNIENRSPFNPKSSRYRLQKRIKTASKLPLHVKTAIYLWFGNCVEYLRTGKPLIDGIELDFSILFVKGKNTDKVTGIGLTGVIYSLAETGVFGNILETGNANLYDVFARLYQVKTDYDAMLKTTTHASNA